MAPLASRLVSAVLLACCRDAISIALPSSPQLRYQEAEIVALIHFNMATFFEDGDPACNAENWQDPAVPWKGSRYPWSFMPTKPNPAQWFESIEAVGAGISVLTAKHGCGFLLWPSEAKYPRGEVVDYRVPKGQDVVGLFEQAANDAGIPHGFYYSVMKSFKLCRSFAGENSCMDEVLPGQMNLTDNEYVDVVLDQLRELWSNYGPLAELWFDSVDPPTPDGQERLLELIKELQPDAVKSPLHPTRWIGTESGHPPAGEIWSTATAADCGAAAGSEHFGTRGGEYWCPKTCDTTLLWPKSWFWGPEKSIRSVADMIDVYHDTVGRGCVLELDFAIDRDGLVADDHAAVYKGLGQWIRDCYGSPLASAMGTGMVFTLTVPAGHHLIDRVVLQEDISLGQRVYNYTVEGRGVANVWHELVSAEAIGSKRILLFPPVRASHVRLRINDAFAMPQLKHFGVYAPCDSPKESKQNEQASSLKFIV